MTSSMVFAPAPAARISSVSISAHQLFFLLIHIPLAFIMYTMEGVATLHAWATIGFGTLLAIKSDRPEPLIYICGYVVGCDVLWRLTDAHVFHQGAKYLIAWIFILGLLRFRSPKMTLLPLIYFALLIPSIAVSIDNANSLRDIKYMLSFNLSGPFAFTVSALFLSRLWISPKNIQRTLFFILAPILGICTLTIYSTVTASQLRFFTQSNMITSAGFSPNQVSAILGLGGFLCYFFLLTGRGSGPGVKALMLIGVIILTVESALTFSRGGVYMEIAAAVVVSYYLLNVRGVRLGLFILAGLLILLFNAFVLPQLDSFTRGKFSARFMDTNPTHRDTLILDDLRAFRDHALLGLGPGRSKFFRSGDALMAHTEYTRLIGEHGVLGLAALAIFLLMLYERWRHMGLARPLLGPLLIWSMLYLCVYATRSAAPVFLMGLSFTTLLPSYEGQHPREYPASVPRFTGNQVKLHEDFGNR